MVLVLTPGGDADNCTSSLPGSTDMPPKSLRQPEGEVRSGTEEMRQGATERSGGDLPSAPLLYFVSYLAIQPCLFLRLGLSARPRYRASGATFAARALRR